MKRIGTFMSRAVRAAGRNASSGPFSLAGVEGNGARIGEDAAGSETRGRSLPDPDMGWKDSDACRCFAPHEGGSFPTRRTQVKGRSGSAGLALLALGLALLP